MRWDRHPAWVDTGLYANLAPAPRSPNELKKKNGNKLEAYPVDFLILAAPPRPFINPGFLPNSSLRYAAVLAAPLHKLRSPSKLKSPSDFFWLRRSGCTVFCSGVE